MEDGWLDETQMKLYSQDLRNIFQRAKGIPAGNSQGEPDIDYVKWLEEIVLFNITHSGKNSVIDAIISEDWHCENKSLGNNDR